MKNDMRMRKRSGQMETAGDVISNMKEVFFGSDAYQFWLFQKKWKAFVGEVLAKESYIGRSERNVLFIYVQNSVWMQELFMRKAEILEKIRNDAFGSRFTELRFVGASEKAAAPVMTNVEKARKRYRDMAQDRKATLTDAEEAWITDFMEKRVSQKELREALTQMMEDTLRRRKAELADGYTPCQKCGRLCPAKDRLCKSCELKEREQTKNRIFLQLLQEPASYHEEINKTIPCDYLQYETAREMLIRRCKDQYFKGYDREKNQKLLLSLLIHKPPETMTKEEIESTLSNLAKEKNDIEEYEKKEKKEAKRYGKSGRN